MQRVRKVSGRSTVLVAALYVILTAWMMWPLPRYAGSAVQDPGDPLFQIWVMRSVQHRLIHHPLELYQATAFYGFNHTLAYSEEAISTALVAWPIYLVTGNDVLTYNLLFLFTFWLMAFGVFLLARELGAYPAAAFIAGVLAAFAPARFGHISHLNLSWLGCLPVVLWALTVFARRGQRRYLVIAGVTLAFVLLSSLHLALFTTMGLAFYLPFLLLSHRQVLQNRRALLLAGVALAVPYLLLAPTLIPHLRVGDEYGFVRSRAEIDRLAATPRSYFMVFPTNHFWKHALGTRFEPFFPGAVAIVGAALSVLAWRRWPVWFGAALAVVATILSFGFSITLMGHRVPMPYTLVYDLLPPIRNIRGVGRFGLLTAIALPLLAAFGYTAAWKRVRERVQRWSATAGLALAALLVLVACVELRSGVGTWHVPDDAQTTAVYDWLAEQPHGPVIEFPAAGLFHDAYAEGDNLLQPIRYMYFSTRHWDPLVNGYSGFIPPQHFELMRLFADHDGQPSMVTQTNIGVLQDLGVRWVVIHHLTGYDWQQAVSTAGSLPELRHVADPGDSTVFEVTAEGRQARKAPRVSFDLQGRATAGAPYAARVRFENPDDTSVLIGLEQDPTLTLTWTDASGKVVGDTSAVLDRPLTLPPGESTVYVSVTAPTEPGTYRLRATVDDGSIAATEQEVTVHALDADTPVLALESLDWDHDATLRPGDTLRVSTSWRVLQPPEGDYAATIQLLDADGERVAGADLGPGVGMPETSALAPDHVVDITFSLSIPANLPPGDYQILAALYAPQGDFPRQTILLLDGTVAQEMIVGGVSIRP
jgi:hypothetical protein